jgi:hypothetical protein
VILRSQSIDKQNPKFTIRGNVGIPRTIGSQQFRTCFTGIYEANLSVNLRIAKRVFAGIGYQNALFKVQKTFVFIKANNGAVSYNTQIIENGGFFKLGYDKFIGNAAYISWSLNAGMLACQYTSVIPDTSYANRPYGPQKFTAPYVQPEFSVNFMAGEEQRMSFCILLSYTTLFSKFDPTGPRLNHIDEPPVHIKGNRYFMNWLNVGLGFNVLIGKRSGGTVRPPADEEKVE